MRCIKFNKEKAYSKRLAKNKNELLRKKLIRIPLVHISDPMDELRQAFAISWTPLLLIREIRR